jgi:hypothetical protein
MNEQVSDRSAYHLLHMVDFDGIDHWASELSQALSEVVPSSVVSFVSAGNHRYVEDAKAQLFTLAPRDAIIDTTLNWIRSNTIVAYHGSRMTAEDEASIRSTGLMPLVAEARRQRLERALSKHPNWPAVEGGLSAAIEKHGQGNAAGHREGQVHLTLSRGGLVNGFNHYLTHGSEFDQRVACALLGQDGVELLARDGVPTLVQVAVPGTCALEGAHPHFSIDDMLCSGEVPNLVNQFLEAWSYRIGHPNFQSRTLKVDCGIRFGSVVPAAWIVSMEHV